MKLSGFFIGLLIPVGFAAATEVRAADAASIERGKYLYEAADCYSCHSGPRGR